MAELHPVFMSEFHYEMMKVLKLQINLKRLFFGGFFLVFLLLFFFSLSFHFVQTKNEYFINISFVRNYTTLTMLSHQKQICDIILPFIQMVVLFVCLVFPLILEFFLFRQQSVLMLLVLCFLQSCVYIYIFINSLFKVFFSLFILLHYMRLFSKCFFF